MASLDLLTVIAEIAAAFAGFAALVSVLRRDHRDRLTAFGVVETSLIAIVFALLPGILGNLRIAALLFLFVWSAAWVHAASRSRRLSGTLVDRSYAHPVFIATAFAINLAGSTLALMVALAIWPEHAARLYASAASCPLLMACLLLWQIVRRLAFSDDSPAT